MDCQTVKPSLNPETLIHKRIMNHKKKIKNELKTNKLIYSPGDLMRIQNIRTKDWELLGTVETQQVADDRSILSYEIKTHLGYPTTRHRRFLRPLVEKTTPAAQECTSDPGIPHNSEETSKQDLPQSADSRDQVVATQARPRRSERSIKRPVRLGSSVKCIRLGLDMGGSCSCEDTKKKLKTCEEKVKSLKQLISAYTGKN